MDYEFEIREIDALVKIQKEIFEDAQEKLEHFKNVSFKSSMKITSLLNKKIEIEEQLMPPLFSVAIDVLDFVYSNKWTIVKKTEFILSNVIKKIASTREIAEAIKRREEKYMFPIMNV